MPLLRPFLIALTMLALLPVASAQAAESKLVTSWSSPPAKWIVPSNATLTVTIANEGNGQSDAAGLAITLPTQLMLLSLTPSQGTCDLTAVTCTFGALPAGQSLTVAVRAKARTYGTGTITADATGSDDYSEGDYQTAALALELKARPAAKLQIARNAKWEPRTCGTTFVKACLLFHGARVRFTGSAKPVGSTVASRVATIQLQRRKGTKWIAGPKLTTSVILGTPRGGIRVLAGPRTATSGYWRARVSVPDGQTTVAVASAWVYFKRT